MKASFPVSRRGVRPTGSPGFALIITLSLMVLLMVLSVGLLTLSSVSLREASRAQATATARANARLAIQLAVGDLQKSLGPDRAVTAPSDLLGEDAKPGWVGVWDAWACDPAGGAPDYAKEKASRFRRWLASSAEPSSMLSLDQATRGDAGDMVSLVSATTGEGKMDAVRAGRVRVDGQSGAFAWHVSDEAMKARIDMTRDPSRNSTLAERRALVAGHRSGIRTLSAGKGTNFDFLPADDTRDAFQRATVVSSALVDLGQTDLLASKPMVGDFRHDLTTCSLGVLADVRQGGLKRDLTAAFECAGGLPAELTGKKLYESTHGVTGVSDPYWSALSGYYNCYKKARNPETLPSYKVESLDPVRVDRHVVPRNYDIAPVIAKFDVVFSIVAHDAHGPHVAPLAAADPQRKYMLHLVYVPLVTLYNPYNVELEFERINLIASDVPVAFKYYINGQPQTSRFVNFNEMWAGDGSGSATNLEKSLRFDLGNWTSVSQTKPGSNIRMRPGQTLVFAPYFDPTANSAQTMRASWGTRDSLQNAPEKALKLRPGFFGKGVGQSVDFLRPPGTLASTSLAPLTGVSSGVIGLRMNDTIAVETAMRRPPAGVNTEWDVSAKIVVNNREITYGGMRFVYETETILTKFFPKTSRFPSSGSFDVSKLYEPYNKPLKDQARAQVITSFATAARTCNGGVYETDLRDPQPGALNTLRDGSLAGKPFLHHNPARAAIQVNLKKDLPGRFTHELNFQPLKGEMDDVLELDATNRGPLLTGNTIIKGIKSGALFDVPSGPLQTLAGFRRSNALSSTYLPNFVQPLANSAVSPLMSTAMAKQEGAIEYALLDHSYLANHALYDGYYFSTFATQGKRAADAVFADFIARREPLATQCFEPWTPAGVDPESEVTRLFQNGAAAPATWFESAAWQTVKGSFNVNSTRVLAWKAMLSSLAGTEIPVLWAKSLGLEPRPGGKVPVTALTLPLGGLATDSTIDPLKIDNRRTNEWNGYRSLDDDQLDALASRIVDEVKARGPFLSMSDFVNRRLGSSSLLTRGGALHQAIIDSRINDYVFTQMIPVRAKDVADPNIYGYATPEAATGNPAEGAPGWITQGDLLHLLEPRATVRGDTFVVRACGQALDHDGKVEAKVYAEAVVQRVPDYLDPANPPTAALDALNEANRRFGRRFEIVSFRWLTPNEI
jgi:hypothetical protein